MSLHLPDAKVSEARILIVEDEPLIAEMIAEALEEQGYVVVGPVPRLSDAVGIAREASIDAALLDIDLNGEGVFPVADVLSERAIPFMFLTGYVAEGLAPAHRRRPIMHKPVRPDDLLEGVAKLVAR